MVRNDPHSRNPSSYQSSCSCNELCLVSEVFDHRSASTALADKNNAAVGEAHGIRQLYNIDGRVHVAAHRNRGQFDVFLDEFDFLGVVDKEQKLVMFEQRAKARRKAAFRSEPPRVSIESHTSSCFGAGSGERIESASNLARESAKPIGIQSGWGSHSRAKNLGECWLGEVVLSMHRRESDREVLVDARLPVH
jgi:hypothetical protein